jgi:hypothetical protein
MLISAFLKDTKLIRSRTVYDLITLIAEVSGFADLFMLGFGALMNLLYTPKAIDADVINHMDFKVSKKKVKKVAFSQTEDSLLLDKKGIMNLVKFLSNQVRFKLSESLLVLS